MTAVSDEFKLKRAWSYAAPRHPADVLPVVYGAMTGGSGGLWNCPCLDTANFVYAVAGHPVLSLAEGNQVTVYDRDGLVISPSEYTFAAEHDFQGRGPIATVTFISDYAAAEPMAVRCQGRAASGVLMENAVDIVEDFLVNLAGFSPEELDSTSFERARAQAAASGLKLSGLIEADRTVGEILSEMLFPWADWWRDKDGRLRLRVEAGPGSYSEADTAGYFPAGITGQAGIEADLEALVNQVEVEYAYNYSARRFEAGDDGQDAADALSQSVYGIRRKLFSFKWLREEAVVRVIQSGLVGRFKEPPLIVSLTRSDGRAVCLERGDLVAVSLDWFYDRDGRPWANQLLKVIEIETDFTGPAMSFRLQYLGRDFYLTSAYPADGSRLADGNTRAGGDRDRTEYF